MVWIKNFHIFDGIMPLFDGRRRSDVLCAVLTNFHACTLMCLAYVFQLLHIHAHVYFFLAYDQSENDV